MRPDRHDLPMVVVIAISSSYIYIYLFPLLIVATLLLGFQFKLYFNVPLPCLFENFERFDLGLFLRLRG